MRSHCMAAKPTHAFELWGQFTQFMGWKSRIKYDVTAITSSFRLAASRFIFS